MLSPIPIFYPRWHRATFLPAMTYPPITLLPGDIILITAEKYCTKCRNGCSETSNYALLGEALYREGIGIKEIPDFS